MGKYFGTDGFRGEANVKLTADHAFKVGRYIGRYFGCDHRAKIVIGRDTRISGLMFESALTAGLTASGADAYLLHITTTPNVSYAVRTGDFDCGIMISASHNPFYDNGIKIIGGTGRKIETEIEKNIEAYIDGESICPLAAGEDIGRSFDFSAGVDRYVEHLVFIPAQSFKGLKIGLDCSNGSASSIAKRVFDELGASTYVINDEPDGTNINSDCGSTHIETLQRYVKEQGLDMGFAYDGDADRCIAVAGDGRVIDGDLILYVCGKHMKEQGVLKGDTVVTTVMSNLGLYKAFDRESIRYEKTDVGDRYVAENMDANGFVLGGEQSGHIIFGDYAATGDGILTSLMLTRAVLEKNISLADLVSEVKIYPQLLENLRVDDKDRVLQAPEVKEAVKEVEERLGEDGRVLVRKSGTEPLLRVMVEAENDELCRECVLYIINAMKGV